MKTSKVSRPNAKQQWYSVRIIFESAVEDSTDIPPLCEDRVVLFSRSTQRVAISAAKAYGKKAEHSYRNQLGDLVKWRFKEIHTIEALDAPRPSAGWEVASRLFRRSDQSTERDAESDAATLYSAALERAKR